jgi:hypothetical protein
MAAVGTHTDILMSSIACVEAAAVPVCTLQQLLLAAVMAGGEMHVATSPDALQLAAAAAVVEHQRASGTSEGSCSCS